MVPPDDLPGLSRTGPPVGSGGRVVRPLPSRLPAAIGALAARYGSTPFGVYAAALAVLLDCLLSRPDVLIGVVAADRDRPELADVVGPLIDVLPVRLDLGDDPPFATLARRAAGAAGVAVAHGGTPAASRATATGAVRPHGTMLTPVLLSVQPETVPVRATAGAVRVELLGELETGAAQCDLAVFVNATASGTELQIEYADDRFARAAASELADRLVRLLEQAVADPGRPVSGLDGLDAAQRERLLALGDGGPAPDAPHTTVPDAIVAHAALRPAAPAVRDDDGELDYAGLVEAADRIAAALLTRGVRAGDLVAACLPRDRMLPAALLGIWRAGAAYLPLDPALPPRRLRDLIADAGAVAVVAGAETAGSLPADAVVMVEDLVAVGPPAGPLPRARPDALAYVLYTSGSTGVPKGVEVSHANLAWFLATTDALVGVGPQDVFLAVTAVTSDISCFDLWAALGSGASTVVVSRELAVDGAALGERMAATGVTILNVTPTQLRVLVAGGWKGHPALRVVSGGEALDGALAADLHARAAEVWNAYGPTETSVTAMYHRVGCPPEALVPIGRPSPGALAYVVDRAGRPVPPGVTGELWIGGAGVARGYRCAPERTAAAFVRDPFRSGGRCYRTGDLVRWRDDGLLDFVGRDDDQVKVHGYRIELGEIEAALHACPVVAEAAVTVHRPGTPQAQLVGHLVARSGVHLDPAAVEAAVREVLPPALVPRRWLTPPSLPRNATGKVDRLTLAAAVGADSPTGPARGPESDVERYLVRLWGDVLDNPAVGVDDDFFALGGDSLAATRLTGRVREELGVDVGARLLFEHPVLAGFAVELEDRALDLLDAEDEG